MAKSKPSRYKGKVGVSVNRGGLRLRLPRFLFGGQQKFLYTGLRDTPNNRKIAEAKAKQIEADIFFEKFDYSLESYKINACPDSEQRNNLTILELYSQFIEAKKPTVRPGTFRGGYVVMLNHLKKSPFVRVIPDADQTAFAQGLVDWAVATLSPDTARRFLVQLNACFNWAIASQLVQLEESPLKNLTTRVFKPRCTRDIEPFTLQERNQIINQYKFHPKYKHYALFVEFCFSVGCRPSEAIALQRENISADLKQITFTHAVVTGEEGKRRIKGLKTQDKRTIYTSNSVQALLRVALSSSNQIVFPGVRGGLLGYGTFRKNWKVILAELNIRYRNPYQMRHTFITLCLETGMNVKDLAKIVGNSPEVIYRHYAENQLKVAVPDW